MGRDTGIKTRNSTYQSKVFFLACKFAFTMSKVFTFPSPFTSPNSRIYAFWVFVPVVTVTEYSRVTWFFFDTCTV